MENGKIEIATKYRVDADNRFLKYTKQGSDNGTNTKETIIKVMQQQQQSNKNESE